MQELAPVSPRRASWAAEAHSSSANLVKLGFGTGIISRGGAEIKPRDVTEFSAAVHSDRGERADRDAVNKPALPAAWPESTRSRHSNQNKSVFKMWTSRCLMTGKKKKT